MYSGSVAATGTQSTGSAILAASAQSRSRPSVSAAVACGRCRITQCCGLWLARSMARSRIGLYSMTRLTSIPHDAETITVGSASLIRVASSGAAKPPNTTECNRPDPGARQHGDQRLRDHRQVHDHPVALVHPQAAQHPGEPCDLVLQFGVREAALAAGHRAVVDQRGLLAAAVSHVPVHRVEAGVHHPVGEPPVERRPRPVEHHRRRLVTSRCPWPRRPRSPRDRPGSAGTLARIGSSRHSLHQVTDISPPPPLASNQHERGIHAL